MSGVSLRHVCKNYSDDFQAVRDFNLNIGDKEFIVLVGPSGCGKSTVLRTIAGLEDITSGDVYIGDTCVNDISSKDRDIAMVFQNYALYPHMTVYDNMAFGLKLRKLSKTDIDKKVKEAAKILNIEQLLDRKPKELSGGQRQRVAMGRAIVRNPKIFLMDEPLSNLDAKLRVQMRTEISKLYKKLKTTFIYVTHDQVEAMTLGTRIVVMKDGIIQQVGVPQDIYTKPANIFVAGFIGSPQMNFINAKIVKDDSGKIKALFGNETLSLEDDISNILKTKNYVGKEVILGVRPENISILEKNGYQFKVDMTEIMGAETYIYLSNAENNITARVNGICDAKSGEIMNIGFDLNKIHIFDSKTKLNILL